MKTNPMFVPGNFNHVGVSKILRSGISTHNGKFCCCEKCMAHRNTFIIDCKGQESYRDNINGERVAWMGQDMTPIRCHNNQEMQQ